MKKKFIGKRWGIVCSMLIWFSFVAHAVGVGGSGMFQWSVELRRYISTETGKAPRTNLCGYGAANVEWGRNRNINGIPGLMVEGEYEWWEARVNPALAFRMMYPESCISFLCDTGRGHLVMQNIREQSSHCVSNYQRIFILKYVDI